jgi:hypothetical protein
MEEQFIFGEKSRELPVSLSFFRVQLQKSLLGKRLVYIFLDWLTILVAAWSTLVIPL